MQSIRHSIFIFLFLFSFQANGASLFGVVSDRSAPEVAAGAAHFEKENPGHKLTLRTTTQFMEMTDLEIKTALEKSDAILLGAVFGDSVTRLQRIIAEIQTSKNTLLFATNSDPRITRLSYLKGISIFKGLDNDVYKELTSSPLAEKSFKEHIDLLAQRYPTQTSWLQGRGYWQNRGSENMAGLIAWLLNHSDKTIQVPKPIAQAPIRYYRHGKIYTSASLSLTANKKLAVILDHNTGDRMGDKDLLDAVCDSLEKKNIQCIAVLARWGEASMQAINTLTESVKPAKPDIILSLQDFAIGGGEYRERVTELLAELNVPVLKGIRLTDRTEQQWRLSTDGIPWDGVHYRVAMPELQGVSQPMILATAKAAYLDSLTGVKLSPAFPVEKQVESLVQRMSKWLILQDKSNKEKKIAIIYYNHPPGRHNIGADNLDVPASLLHLLNELKNAGYNTGELPSSQDELLSLMQRQGINLPNDAKALEEMAGKIVTLENADYQKWFSQLPETVQNEMDFGPLGNLQSQLFEAVDSNQIALGHKQLQHVVGDIDHLLQGIQHPARDRALDLLAQLKNKASALLQGENTRVEIQSLTQALHATGIEGLRGWGVAPGKVMIQAGRMLLPGIQFGNVFIGPQPPRGWEVNEELLHANMAFPPTHQYLGFYYWLQHQFKADALVHLGRHSTYEFLPYRRVGLTSADYPYLIAADIPGIYPYIVDGVGEGIQAKRRGLAVMIDHLTPPLNVTPLYDELLRLRQLVESYESAQEQSPARQRAVKDIRELIVLMNLRDELESIMKDELVIRGIGFEQVDDEMLVHEVGHYLTKIQEQFMPMGLHIFAKDWENEAVAMMLKSINQPEDKKLPQLLKDSPREELKAFLSALDGKFVKPGKGNDPIRTPDALPTGRNFHALDSSLIPSRIGYELGLELANQTRAEITFKPKGKEAVILWASDTVRDEGVMVAFGFDMLGLQPVWNSRGKFKGLKRLELTGKRVRRDVVFTTSGLFRDLYADLLVWLDKAVLLALDGASLTIERKFPELKQALEGALQPIKDLRHPGNESLEINQVAMHWVAQAKMLLMKNIEPAQAGRQASLRLFGDAPGSYGAGVNRLVERSASWETRQEIAEAFIKRMGHAYGVGINGLPAQENFIENLKTVQNTYLGRSSNLYGLLDNNDAFDYMGGLSMTVEKLSGKVPANRVLQHANPEKAELIDLDQALLSELRGQFLNPAWIKALMKHDYAGARTMGSEFMEYLWGWQVTNPEIIKSWVWDEVKLVYVDDKHKLGLDEFLEEGHNVHVKTNMLGIMLVAIHKGFWEADQRTIERLAEQFAKLVVSNGLPGSGHTQPNHPMLDWMKNFIDAELAQQLNQVQVDARGIVEPKAAVTTTVAELQPLSEEEFVEPTTNNQAHELDSNANYQQWILLLLVLIIFSAGVMRGRRFK